MDINIIKDLQATVNEADRILAAIADQIENVKVDNKPGSALEAIKEAKSLVQELNVGAMRPMKALLDASLISVARQAKIDLRQKKGKGDEE